MRFRESSEQSHMTDAVKVSQMSAVRRRTLIRGLVGLTAGTALGGCGSPIGEDPTGMPSSGRLQPLEFPADFVWGVATSAYQVEGAATSDGRGPSVWDVFTHRGGASGDTGDVAADQYHRYAEDVALMKRLGVTSYRFSISWPRVQPAGQGAVNQAGLDYYRRLIDSLHHAEIMPMATLWHWDTPQALQDIGGWESREVAYRFADYADIIFRAFGADINAYLTLNEPKTVVQQGYSVGVHAPGIADPVAATKAMHHLLLGHGLAVSSFRAVRPNSRLGVCLGLTEIQRINDSAEVTKLARDADVRENTLYLDPILKGRYPLAGLAPSVDMATLASVNLDGDLDIIGQPIDFLGLNYYGPATVGGHSTHAIADPAHWLEIDPESLYRVLVRLDEQYDHPVISITENGRPVPLPTDLATDPIADAQRIEYLGAYLVQAHRAISKGVQVSGWHAWSLLDNFEWSEGYRERWGMFYVDFDTLQRRPKQSSEWYSNVIRTNSI